MTTPVKAVVKPITLLRIAVAPVVCEPLQWSDNSQLAVNGNDQLALVEPAIPSLQQSVQRTDDFIILLPREIFSTHRILNAELIETLPLRKLCALVYPNSDEPFHLRNISEPHLVQHAWAPADPFTHNCLLGVLFSTGEMLLFDRQNLLTHTCAVKHLMFEELLYEFGIKVENHEAIIDAGQLNCLKIKTFAFHCIESSPHSISLLNVITASGTILIYSSHSNTSISLEKLLRIDTGLDIVRQNWSPWFERDDAALYSFLAITDASNLVLCIQIRYDTISGEMAASATIELSPPLRFMIQSLKWGHLTKGNAVLLVGSTIELAIYSIAPDFTCCTSKERLSSVSAISGVISRVRHNVLECAIGHENGNFQAVKYDLSTRQTQRSSPIPTLVSLVERVKYNFQMADAGADADDELNVKTESQAFSKSDMQIDSECLFVCHGMTLDKNGYVTLAYRAIPRNGVQYQTISQRLVQIVMIRVLEFFNPKTNVLDNSSIAHINLLWLSTFDSAPVPQESSNLRDLTIKESDIVNKYIDELRQYKEAHFIDMSKIGTIATEESPDLAYSLLHNFSHSITVKKVQHLNCFNRILVECVRHWAKNHESAQVFLLMLEAESEAVETLLSKRLSTLVLEHAVAQPQSLSTAEDEFVVIKHYHTLASIDIESANKYKDRIPQSAAITVQSKFFAETFTASVFDRHTKDILVVSDSNHRWTGCRLTHMPLLQMNHRKDEMKLFNYMAREQNTFQGSQVLATLLDTMGYCFLTGNRVFNLH